MSKLDRIYLGVLFFAVALVVVILVTSYLKSVEDREFRLSCIQASGIPVVDTPTYGDVCVDSFIELGP
jgi:hypothetical protein